MIAKREFAFYIHIPFCDKKCYYCDFNSFVAKDNSLKKAYINALINELRAFKEYAGNITVSSIYIGGGTPTTLDVQDINRLFDVIKDLYTINNDCEITIEANPESVTLGKVQAYQKIGINRVSIGLQSTHNEILKDIGRLHDYETFLSTYKLFRDNGFDNISIDLISGLPALSVQDYKKTLDCVIGLAPEHISAYSLIIEHGSYFYTLLNKGKLTLDEDIDFQMFELTMETLNKAGYEQYEISNYCKNGLVSKHNSCYWLMKEYKGFGISASSYYDNVRRTNIATIKDYCNNSADLRSTEEIDYTLDERKRIEETLFLGLRMLNGLAINSIYKRLNPKDLAQLKDKINRQINEGYLHKENDIIRLTRKGIIYSNTCFSNLLFD